MVQIADIVDIEARKIISTSNQKNHMQINVTHL